MNFRPLPGRDRPEVNLIAFIDVLLVIVIFLMVSTSFHRFGALRLSLPDAAADPAQAKPCSVAVAVAADGRVLVGGAAVAAGTAALTQALADAAHGDPACQVKVQADALATHQSVVRVMEGARLAGLPTLAFTTRSGPAE